MKVRVRPFAFYRELLGLRALEVQVADRATLADLKDSLDKTFPKLRGYLPLMAVNGEMKQLFDPLKDGDEVALLPPFSGGCSPQGQRSCRLLRRADVLPAAAQGRRPAGVLPTAG